MRTNNNQREPGVAGSVANIDRHLASLRNGDEEHTALHPHGEHLRREVGYRKAVKTWNNGRRFSRRTTAAILAVVLLAGIVTAQVVGPLLFSTTTSLNLVTLAMSTQPAANVAPGAQDVFAATATYSGGGTLAHGFP